MRHKVSKFFSIAEFEKEEKWLNEMSAKGLQLVSIHGTTYEFEEGTPSEYIYRLELLDYLPKHPESQAYIQFLEATGVQMIGSYLRWAYFRKKSSEGAFDLYSDISSKMKHYKRIRTFGRCLTLGIGLAVILNAIIVGVQLSTGALHFMNLASYPNWAIVVVGLVGVGTFMWMMRPIHKRIKELEKEQLVNE